MTSVARETVYVCMYRPVISDDDEVGPRRGEGGKYADIRDVSIYSKD